MNKRDAQKELEVLKAREAELLSIINKPEVTPEQRFLEMMNGLAVVIKKEYPNSIFYFRGDIRIWEINEECILFNYVLFWRIFKTEFSMEDGQIQQFTQDMLEKHFKMKGCATKAFQN